MMMASYSFCFYVNSGFFFWHDFPLDRRKREIGLFRACDGVKEGKKIFFTPQDVNVVWRALYDLSLHKTKRKFFCCWLAVDSIFLNKCYYSVLITATVQQLLQKYSKSGGKSITNIYLYELIWSIATFSCLPPAIRGMLITII